MRMTEEDARYIADAAVEKAIDHMERKFVVQGWFSEEQYERISAQLGADFEHALKSLDFEPDERL